MIKKKFCSRTVKTGRAFSIIELVVTIAIMAVLSAVLAPVLLHYVENARTQRDVSATSEIINAVKIGLADEKVYDELIDCSELNNISCYVDEPAEKDYLDNKIENLFYQYSFDDDTRLKDETPYYAAGNMRGVTITFKPVTQKKGSVYVIGDGVINKFISSDDKKLSNLQNLYGSIRNVIGDKLEQISQTYRNSEYTVFINIGNMSDSVEVYGQYSGTNLTTNDVNTYIYSSTTDRITYEEEWFYDHQVETYNNCDHVTEIRGGIAATCLTTGYSGDKVCSECGEYIVYGEETPIADHVGMIVNQVAATCTSEGYTGDSVCEVCGLMLNQGLPTHLIDHSPKIVALVDPTCETDGSTEYQICDVCGIVLVETQSIPALGHSYSFVRWEWEGLESARVIFICDVCENEKIVDATMTTTVTDATCESDGEIAHMAKAILDGKIYMDNKREIIETVGHINGDASTCTTPQVCSVCGIALKEALGHTSVDGNSADIHKKCSVCGLTLVSSHTYAQSVAIAATCTVKGTTKYTCACGYSYTNQNIAINPNNHTGTIVNGGTSSVHSKYSCCGAVISTTHNYSDKVTTAATCVADGVRTYTCTCGYFYTESISKTGHTGVNGGTNETHKKCSICGVTLSATHVYYSSVSIAATCTAKGTTKYTCACGYSYTEQNLDINPANHTGSVVDGGTLDIHTKYNCCGTVISSNHIYTNVSTSSQCRKCECGYIDTTHNSINGNAVDMHTKCNDCGYIISATHNYINKVTTEATCVNTGIRTYTCSCGYSYTEIIAAKGHTEVNGGTYDVHKKCSVCGTTTSSAHIYSTTIPVAATCTTKGTTKYTCACGYSYSDQNVAINASNHTGSSVNVGTKDVHTKYSCCGAVISTTHSYTNKVTTSATCTTDGVRNYTCNCGYSYTESIAATGHTSVNGGTSNIHTKCSICGVTLSSAHIYTSKITTSATCTTDGIKTYTCGCGYSYTENVTKTGHIEVNGGTSAVHKKCSVCGVTTSSTHAYTSAISAEATCITKGTTKYTCSCGYTYTDQNITINPNKHSGSIMNGGTADIHTKYSCCGIVVSSTHNYTNVTTASQCRKCECGYIDTTHNSVNGNASGVHAKCSDCGYTISATHNYTNKVTTAATCTNTGIRTYTCGCGYSYTETIAKANHTEVNGGTSDVHKKCSVCGATISNAHIYAQTVSVNATCTVKGTTKYTCSCGYSYTSQNLAIDPDNHSGSAVNGGIANIHSKYSCCGTVISTTHNYTNKVTTSATCTTAGIRTYACGCGYSYTESIAATGHTSVSGGTSGVHTKCGICGTTISSAHTYTSKVTTAATCTTDGIKTYTCGCGYSYTESIVKTGHTEVNGGTSSVHKKCSVCGTTLLTTHTYTQTVSIAATCTTKGTTKYTCTCGYNYTEQNIAINPNNHTGSAINGGTANVHTKYSCCGATISSTHSYTNVSTSDQCKKCSCGYVDTTHVSVNGGTSGAHAKCSDCGYIISATHSYTNKVTTSATCTKAGVRTYTCACGYSYTESIAATGHTEINGGAADIHKKCSICGVTISSAHAYASTVSVAATCTTKGTTKYTCSCGYSYTDQNIAINANNHTGSAVNGGTSAVHTKYSCCGSTISATHSYTNTVTTAATCTTNGIRTYTCGCGYTYTESIASTGHTSVNGGTANIHTKCSKCGTTLSTAHIYISNVTTAATCTADGVRTYTCECGHSYTEAVAKTGHTEVNGGTSSVHKKCSVCGVTLSSGHVYTSTVSIAATCTTKGTTKYACACGYSYTDQNIAINSNNHTGSAVNVGTESVHTKYGCCGATISATHSYTNVKASAQCRTCSCGYVDTTHTSVNGGTSSAHIKCGDCGYVISASHSYSSSTTSYATCTSTGTRKYTCSCGYYYTSSYGPNGHSYSSSVTTSATCTTNGVRTYSCSNCSSSYTESIPAPGHTPGAAATCTTAQTCTTCSATITPAPGHSYSAATCTTAKTCSKCGATSGTVPGHSWVAATCTDPKTCSRCGTTSGTKLGHSYSAATCTTLQTCSKCGKTKGELASHSYSDATCTSPKTCKNCGATSGSKLGHSYSAATCTKAKTCSRCGATSGSALGHNEGAAATCTSAKTCTRCSYVYQAALGHRWVTKNGKTTCNRCGISYES